MKRTFFLEILVAVTVLAGCGRGTPSAGADTTAAAAPVATVVPPAGGELASSRTFNSLLGNFQFAVPDVWVKLREDVISRAHATTAIRESGFLKRIFSLL